MRVGVTLIRSVAAAAFFIAPASPGSIEAPARIPPGSPELKARFEAPQPGVRHSGSSSPRSEKTRPQSILAFVLACVGAAGTRGTRATRRSILGAALVSVAASPRRASASYSLYSASQASFDERKKNGFVPVATSDRATLQEIQRDLDRKRPERLRKKAKVVYCAGDTAWVTPYLDNACTEFGASKADQTVGKTIEEITGQVTLPDYRRNLNF